MKKTRFTDEANGHDSAGGRPAAGTGGRQAARRERLDDLQLAQTLRDAGTGRREAPPPARPGERSELAGESDRSSPIPLRLHEDVDHIPILVNRPPQVLRPTLNPHEQLTEIRRISLAAPPPPQPCVYSGPNVRHHWRIVSYVTLMPRSARRSSVSRQLRLNRWYNHTA